MTEAVIKIRGEHTFDFTHFTLSDNAQTSIDCTAVVSYNESRDETIITLTPNNSNSIGGSGNSWSIAGVLIRDGVETAVSISSPIIYGGHAVSSTPALPTEIGTSGNKLNVTTDTTRVTGNVGDNVGYVTINGTKYGIFISALGSTDDFEIKANTESSPLAIKVRGLETYGQLIEFYKTDDGTYLMSAINLVW